MSRLSSLVPLFFLGLMAIFAVTPAAFAVVAVNSLEATSLVPWEWSDFSISWTDNNQDGLFQLSETSGFSGVTYLPFVNIYRNLEAVPVQSSQSLYTGGTALAWSFVGTEGSMAVDPSMWSYTSTGNVAQAYDYTFMLGNGDSYTGTVYAASGQGYYPGLTWSTLDENGLTGNYQITGMEPGGSDYYAKRGQVYISSYHEAATGLDYTPLEYTQGLPSGTDYPGSEKYRGGIAQVTDNHGSFVPQVTDGSADVMPQMNASGHLVWMNWDGNYWQVWYNLGNGTVQLTHTENGSNLSAQITDNDQIYWQGWDGHDYEIYRYDPVTKATIQLTNNSQDDCALQVNSSGQYTWMYYDGHDWEIRYNIGKGVVQRTNNSYDDILPRITDNGMIYWQSWDGHDWEIYSYTFGQSAIKQLTNNSQDDCTLQVNSSGQYTWMYYDGHDWEIRYNMGRGVVQRTNNSYDDILPKITDDGVISWQGWDGHDYEIYTYTFGKSAIKQLTNNTVDDITPAVKNGVLVWSQQDGNYWQIYREVLSTGLVTQITNDNYDNKNPRITTSGQIVWQKWDGSDYEVYAYK
jgi:hypothetical protein